MHVFASDARVLDFRTIDRTYWKEKDNRKRMSRNGHTAMVWAFALARASQRHAAHCKPCVEMASKADVPEALQRLFVAASETHYACVG